MSTGPRILLDTNVWSYLARHVGAVGTLEKARRQIGFDVVVAPAVVYELMRSPNPHQRVEIEFVTRKTWTRLMPEIYCDCMDLLRQIRDRRPEWLLDEPRRDQFDRLVRDWKRKSGGFWERVRSDTTREAERIVMLGGAALEQARVEMADSRRHAAANKLALEGITLDKWHARYPGHRPGWDGDEVEYWRADTELFYWQQLIEQPRSGASSAAADWLLPWIDVTQVVKSEESWRRLFLYEIQPTDMPGGWIRGCMKILQMARRVSPGTPVDNQIASYLTECDYLLTGDKAFAAMIEHLSTDSPVVLGKPVILTPTDDVVARIESAINGD